MGRGNESLFTASGSKDQEDGQPIKIFSGTKGPMALGLGMQHWGHGSNNIRKNGDIMLTLTFLWKGKLSLRRLL